MARQHYPHALLLFSALCLTPLPSLVAQSNAASASAPAKPGLLAKEALAPLIPATVFFAGQVAPTQSRNAGGARLADGKIVEATLVDTSGYSSAIQQKYQAYLITEAALSIDGHTLPAGAYGCGFIANDTFIVMDISGGTLFTAHSTREAEMKRPTPLQMMAAPDGKGYRLYAGRSYVTLTAK